MTDTQLLDWLESLPDRVSIGRRNWVFQRLLYLRYPESKNIRAEIKEMAKSTEKWEKELNS